MEFVIDDRKIFKDFETERSEKMTSLCSDARYAEGRFLDVLDLFGRREPEIMAALTYAQGLDFSKNHLKSSYLSHPLRLATFLLEVEPKIASNYVVTALLHNVPEATKVSFKEIQEVFGETVALGIETLVVDRTVPFASIQESYYQSIFDQGDLLVLIKLLDKIDNLFVLSLNPDDEIRKNYIQEVREHLLTFAYEFNTQLGAYLESLLDSTVQLGFTADLKKQLQEYLQSS